MELVFLPPNLSCLLHVMLAIPKEFNTVLALTSSLLIFCHGNVNFAPSENGVIQYENTLCCFTLTPKADKTKLPRPLGFSEGNIYITNSSCLSEYAFQSILI